MELKEIEEIKKVIAKLNNIVFNNLSLLFDTEMRESINLLYEMLSEDAFKNVVDDGEW